MTWLKTEAKSHEGMFVILSQTDNSAGPKAEIEGAGRRFFLYYSERTWPRVCRENAGASRVEIKIDGRHDERPGNRKRRRKVGAEL